MISSIGRRLREQAFQISIKTMIILGIVFTSNKNSYGVTSFEGGGYFLSELKESDCLGRATLQSMAAKYVGSLGGSTFSVNAPDF